MLLLQNTQSCPSVSFGAKSFLNHTNHINHTSDKTFCPNLYKKHSWLVTFAVTEINNEGIYYKV